MRLLPVGLRPHAVTLAETPDPAERTSCGTRWLSVHGSWTEEAQVLPGPAQAAQETAFLDSAGNHGPAQYVRVDAAGPLRKYDQDLSGREPGRRPTAVVCLPEEMRRVEPCCAYPSGQVRVRAAVDRDFQRPQHTGLEVEAATAACNASSLYRCVGE